jgi:hypothetical protein
VLIVQLRDLVGKTRVGVVSNDGRSLKLVRNTSSLYQLAINAIRQKTVLANLISDRGFEKEEDYEEVANSGRLFLPLGHPDPAHLLISGTGLTHLGSAAGRDSMHRKTRSGEEPLTDSMQMFRWGLDSGKPKEGENGVQPEWFYKGTGQMAVSCGQALTMPGFSLDGGEEPELAGLYVIGPDHQPWRVGFALGNEFSDHVMEKRNYLYLAHSKLRVCSYGPEVLVGEDLPPDIRGCVRILREDHELWSSEFLTGEFNMSHSIANLEHHHFKYAQFRSAGDVHVHFFGTSALSFSAGIQTQVGDVFEIWAPPFVRPLRNPLRLDSNEGIVTIGRL